MKLPQAEHVTIAPQKIRDYILSLEHPVGRFKALFFAKLGFSRETSQEFAAELKRIAVQGSAEVGDRSAYGQKYVVRGRMVGKMGRTAEVVTVWIVLVGEGIPRFVTVYPEN